MSGSSTWNRRNHLRAGAAGQRARDSMRDLQRAVDDFNRRVAVGARVIARKDNGEGVETTTRSAAQILSGHTAVVWLDGISGCYLLDRVTPIASAP